MTASAVVFVMLVAGVSPTMVAAQVPALQVTTTVTPARSEPGTEGTVKFDLENLHATTALRRIEVQAIDVAAALTFDTRNFQVGGAEAGQTASLTIPFSVPSTAEAGFHLATFRIRHCAAGGSDCESFSRSVTIEVRAERVLRLTAIEPSLVDTWGEHTLAFTVENTGESRVRSLELSWSTPNDEILPLGTTNQIRTTGLDAGRTTGLSLAVATAPGVKPGVVPVTVTIKATDVTGNAISESATVGIRIGGDTGFDVSARRATDGDVSVSVANVGVNSARSVAIRAWPAGASSDAADVSFVGDLDEGDFTTMTFDTKAWAAALGPAGEGSGTPIHVEVGYTDATGERRTTMTTATLAVEASGSDDDDGSAAPIMSVFALLALALAAALVVRRRRRAHHDDAFEDDEGGVPDSADRGSGQGPAADPDRDRGAG